MQSSSSFSLEGDMSNRVSKGIKSMISNKSSMSQQLEKLKRIKNANKDMRAKGSPQINVNQPNQTDNDDMLSVTNSEMSISPDKRHLYLSTFMSSPQNASTR